MNPWNPQAFTDDRERPLRTFVPTEDYRRYRVILYADRYDTDGGRLTHDVFALGGTGAEQAALDWAIARGDRDAVVIGVSELCDECVHPLRRLGASPGHDESGCRHASYSETDVRRCGCEVAA